MGQLVQMFQHVGRVQTGCAGEVHLFELGSSCLLEVRSLREEKVWDQVKGSTTLLRYECEVLEMKSTGVEHNHVLSPTA